MYMVKRMFTLSLTMVLALLLFGCTNEVTQLADTGDPSYADDRVTEKAETTPEVMFFSEARYYTDGTLDCIEQYDTHGRILSTKGDIAGADTYYEEYRMTDKADEIDISPVEKMRGVSRAECAQVYHEYTDYAPGLKEQPMYFVVGYNDQGKIKAIKCFYYEDGMDSPVMVYQIEHELDGHGNIIRSVKSAGNGDVLFEREYQNTYEGDKLISSEITGMFYGNQVMRGNQTVRESLETPRPISGIKVEYIY